jgi:DnaJ family protein C protein 8
VKEIEKRDSVLTSSQQIERLLRPGSTYFNLNPFEVLQVEPEQSLEDVKKKYKRVTKFIRLEDNREISYNKATLCLHCCMLMHSVINVLLIEVVT